MSGARAHFSTIFTNFKTEAFNHINMINDRKDHPTPEIIAAKTAALKAADELDAKATEALNKLPAEDLDEAQQIAALETESALKEIKNTLEAAVETLNAAAARARASQTSAFASSFSPTDPSSESNSPAATSSTGEDPDHKSSFLSERREVDIEGKKPDSENLPPGFTSIADTTRSTSSDVNDDGQDWEADAAALEEKLDEQRKEAEKIFDAATEALSKASASHSSSSTSSASTSEAESLSSSPPMEAPTATSSAADASSSTFSSTSLAASGPAPRPTSPSTAASVAEAGRESTPSPTAASEPLSSPTPVISPEADSKYAPVSAAAADTTTVFNTTSSASSPDFPRASDDASGAGFNPDFAAAAGAPSEENDVEIDQMSAKEDLELQLIVARANLNAKLENYLSASTNKEMLLDSVKIAYQKVNEIESKLLELRVPFSSMALPQGLDLIFDAQPVHAADSAVAANPNLAASVASSSSSSISSLGADGVTPSPTTEVKISSTSAAAEASSSASTSTPTDTDAASPTVESPTVSSSATPVPDLDAAASGSARAPTAADGGSASPALTPGVTHSPDHDASASAAASSSARAPTAADGGSAFPALTPGVTHSPDHDAAASATASSSARAPTAADGGAASPGVTLSPDLDAAASAAASSSTSSSPPPTGGAATAPPATGSETKTTASPGAAASIAPLSDPAPIHTTASPLSSDNEVKIQRLKTRLNELKIELARIDSQELSPEEWDSSPATSLLKDEINRIEIKIKALRQASAPEIDEKKYQDLSLEEIKLAIEDTEAEVELLSRAQNIEALSEDKFATQTLQEAITKFRELQNALASHPDAKPASLATPPDEPAPSATSRVPTPSSPLPAAIVAAAPQGAAEIASATATAPLSPATGVSAKFSRALAWGRESYQSVKSKMQSWRFRSNTASSGTTESTPLFTGDDSSSSEPIATFASLPDVALAIAPDSPVSDAKRSPPRVHDSDRLQSFEESEANTHRAPLAELRAASPDEMPDDPRPQQDLSDLSPTELLNQYPIGLTRHTLNLLKESKLKHGTHEIKAAHWRIQEGQANIAHRTAGTDDSKKYAQYRIELETQLTLLQEMKHQITKINATFDHYWNGVTNHKGLLGTGRDQHALLIGNQFGLYNEGFDFRDSEHRDRNKAFLALRDTIKSREGVNTINLQKTNTPAFLNNPDNAKVLKMLAEIKKFPPSANEEIHKIDMFEYPHKLNAWADDKIDRMLKQYDSFVDKFHNKPESIKGAEFKERRENYEKFLNGEDLDPEIDALLTYLHQKYAVKEIFLERVNLLDTENLLDTKIQQLKEQQQLLDEMHKMEQGYDSTLDAHQRATDDNALGEQEVLLTERAISKFNFTDANDFQSKINPYLIAATSASDAKGSAVPSTSIDSPAVGLLALPSANTTRLKLDVSDTSNECSIILLKKYAETQNDFLNRKSHYLTTPGQDDTIFLAGKLCLNSNVGRARAQRASATAPVKTVGVIVPKLSESFQLAYKFRQAVEQNPKFINSFKDISQKELWQNFKGPYTKDGFVKHLAKSGAKFSKINPYLSTLNDAAERFLEVHTLIFNNMLGAAKQLSESYNRVSSNKPAHLVGNNPQMLYFIMIHRTAIMRLNPGDPAIQKAYAFTGGNGIQLAEEDIQRAMKELAIDYQVRITPEHKAEDIYADDLEEYGLGVNDKKIAEYARKTALPAHHTTDTIARGSLIESKRINTAAASLARDNKEIAETGNRAFKQFPTLTDLESKRAPGHTVIADRKELDDQKLSAPTQETESSSAPASPQGSALEVDDEHDQAQESAHDQSPRP